MDNQKKEENVDDIINLPLVTVCVKLIECFLNLLGSQVFANRDELLNKQKDCETHYRGEGAIRFARE